MKPSHWCAGLIGVLLMFLLVGCGSPAWRTIAQGTFVPALGHADVDVQGTVKHPSVVEALVTSKPTVKIGVFYNVNCGSDFAPVSGQAGLDMANVASGSPTTIPVPGGNPSSCFVEVVAIPTHDARVTVIVRAH